MSEKDELRRQVLERFTATPVEEPVKDLTGLINKPTAVGVDLGLNALRQVVEKRTEQEEVSREVKDRARKTVLTEKNTKEMLDMMRMLRS